MDGAGRRLRELLEQPGPVLSPGIFDCVSAKVVEQAGFTVASISGAALTASMLGYPDVGLSAFSEILNQARSIARSVDIPVTVDADTGYGNALNVMRCAREFESAGLAGMMIEDQTFPKRCGHFEGKQVISTDEMVVKIKAACEARRSNDFAIIARTDARAIYGLDHAIERALTYCEAGADIIFVEALLSIEDMQKVGKAIPKPLKANMVEGGKTPMVHYQQLYEMGFKLINYSGTLQRAAMRGMQYVLGLLKEDGSALSAYPERMSNLAERSELLRLPEFYELEERLYGPLMETEGSFRKDLRQKSDGHDGSPRGLPI